MWMQIHDSPPQQRNRIAESGCFQRVGQELSFFFYVFYVDNSIVEKVFIM